MADSLSQIKINNITYNLRDSEAGNSNSFKTTCYKDSTSTGNGPITTPEIVTLADLGITLSSNYTCSNFKVVENKYIFNENVQGYQYIIDIVFQATANKTAGTNQSLFSFKRRFQTDAPEKALLGPYMNMTGVAGGTVPATGYGEAGQNVRTSGNSTVYISFWNSYAANTNIPIKMMGFTPYIATL